MFPCSTGRSLNCSFAGLKDVSFKIFEAGLVLSEYVKEADLLISAVFGWTILTLPLPVTSEFLTVSLKAFVSK